MKDFLTDEEMNALEQGSSTPSDVISDEEMAKMEENAQPKTFGGFMSNLGSSALNFGKGIGSAVMHPVKTVETLASLGLGALSNVGEATGLYSGNDRFNKMADTVGHEYVDRYGGWQNIKNTAYKDPVGVLADLSTVLSGGAGAVTKVGKIAQFGSTAGKLSDVAKIGEAGKIAEAGNITSKASKVSSFLNKSAEIVDPLQNALKLGKKGAGFVVEKGATPVNLALKTFGLTTGRGGETFRQIWEASKAGRTGAVNAMRGGVNDQSLINSLDNANNALRQLANDEWTKLGLDDMTKSLDISPVTKKLDAELKSRNITVDAEGNLDFSRSTVGKTSDQQDIINIYNDVKSWGSRAGDRTPRGIDTLKQRIGSYYDPKSVARSFVEAMRKEARGVLSQIDGYDQYSKNYGDIMDTIGDLKNEMRQGASNPQQTWNKITNTFKQRNTEARQAIVRKLQQDGISDIADEIAGYTAKDLLPNDIIRAGAGFYSLPVVGTINPLLLPTLSPRIMGEIVNFVGKNTGRAERLGSFLKQATKNGTKKIPANQIIQWIGSQVYDKSRATRSSTLQQRLEEGQNEN